MRAIILFLALAFLAQLPAVASQAVEARTLVSIRAANIKSALGELGYNVELTKNPDGFDKLVDKQNRFEVFLGECAGSICKMLQTRHCFAEAKASAELANQWNNLKMFGRAAVPGAGMVCINDTAISEDGIVSFMQIRSQVNGVLSVLPSAVEFFAKG